MLLHKWLLVRNMTRAIRRRWRRMGRPAPGRRGSGTNPVAIGLVIMLMAGAFTGARQASLTSALVSVAYSGGEVEDDSALLQGLSLQQAKQIVQATLPSAMGAGTDETVPQGWRYTARSWVYRLTGFDLARPRTLVAAVLPGQILEESAIEHFPGRQVATEESAPAGASAAESDTANPAEPTTGQAPPAMLAGLRARNWGEKPLVLIYHTHSSEMYDGAQAASTGKAVFHNYNTKETGVIRVGEQLADSLSARYNIPVIHSTAIHDFPSFPQAYNNSAKTVKNILKSYPSIQVVLDLHRMEWRMFRT